MAWVSETALPFVPVTAHFFSAIVQDPTSGEYYVFVLGDGDDQFYKYNITTNLWQQLADPLTRLAGSISISPDGGKLAAHGSPSSTRLYIYDVAGDSWTTSSAAPQINTTNVRIESHVWADNDTVWCQVRAFVVATWYVKFFKYVVSTDTWTSYANSRTVSSPDSKCMCISTDGARLYAGNCGASYRETTKYTIATDTYAGGPSLASAYYFVVSADRYKLWFGPHRAAPAAHQTITRWVNPDTEVLETDVFSEYDPATKPSNLPAGVYGVIMCIAGFMTAAPENLSETLVSLPTVTTDPATSVNENSTQLNGTLDDDGGEACDCGFEWGETVAYGNTTPTQSRTTLQTFAQTIIELDPNQTYHFRAFAKNAAGTSYGGDRMALSTVTADPATSVGQTTATLNGTLDNDGGEACACGFEYGETTNYGTTTPTESKTTGQTFSQEVLGLRPGGIIYHFRAIATNTAGTSRSADRIFHTEALSAEAHQALGKSYPLGRAEL